jgi:hypothetical protein
MKTVSLLVSVLFICISCNCTKNTVAQQSNVVEKQEQDEKTSMAQKDMKIEYEANTRGFYEKRTIENQTIAISKDRDGKDKPVPVKISDADWKQLLAFFNEVNLDGLSNLKAPTEKRFYDGAAIAGLKITIKDKTYETTNFDHGFPPAEIQKLVDKIVSLTE